MIRKPVGSRVKASKSVVEAVVEERDERELNDPILTMASEEIFDMYTRMGEAMGKEEREWVEIGCREAEAIWEEEGGWE